MQQARIPTNDLGVFALLASALTMQPMGHDMPDRRVRTAPATDRDLPRRGWLDRLDHWFWKQEQRAIEAHLAAATDIHDLETRIRKLERGARPWSC